MGSVDGSPSDHPLIKGSFGVTGTDTTTVPRRRRGQSSGNCQDSNWQCAAWAGRGECTVNPAYMSTNCMASCNTCPSNGCSDDNTNCEAWAARNECNINPGYMHVNCRRSCNTC